MNVKITGCYKFTVDVDTNGSKYKEFLEMRQKMDFKKTDTIDYVKYIFDESCSIVNSDDMRWYVDELG